MNPFHLGRNPGKPGQWLVAKQRPNRHALPGRIIPATAGRWKDFYTAHFQIRPTVSQWGRPEKGRRCVTIPRVKDRNFTNRSIFGPTPSLFRSSRAHGANPLGAKPDRFWTR